MKGLKEVIWVTRLLEKEVVAGVKEDRTLWDGTGLMKGKEREEWEEFLEERRKVRVEEAKERERKREVRSHSD